MRTRAEEMTRMRAELSDEEIAKQPKLDLVKEIRTMYQDIKVRAVYLNEVAAHLNEADKFCHKKKSKWKKENNDN